MDDKEFEDFMSKIITPNQVKVYDNDLSLKEIFNKRLKEFNLSQRQVEALLNIEYRTLIGILNRTAKRVDITSLLKLSQFLGITADKILQLYSEKEMNVKNIGEIERAKINSFIISNFDLFHLYKAKFITTKTDLEAIENRIKKFFGFKSIYEYAEMLPSAAFSRTKNSSNFLMRDLWVKSALAQFKKINNPNEYKRELLVDLISKIRPYTLNEENGILIVIRALYHIGVTVIYQPHLETTQVRGATFIVNNKPCIVVTNLYENYPTIWFALFHELHHVLYDFDEINSSMNYHLSGEPDLFLIQEDKANSFAREYLFSDEKSRYIKPFINDHFVVKKYAEENEVHHSIIYSFYQHDMRKLGKNWQGQFNKYIPDISHALKSINTNLWENETMEESVNKIRETVFNI